MKMEEIKCSETSACKIQAPRNYPEESIQYSEHGESLKSRKLFHNNNHRKKYDLSETRNALYTHLVVLQTIQTLWPRGRSDTPKCSHSAQWCRRMTCEVSTTDTGSSCLCIPYLFSVCSNVVMGWIRVLSELLFFCFTKHRRCLMLYR